MSALGLAYRKQIKEIPFIYACPKYKDDRLKISIWAYPPDKRRRDLDNLLKITLDSLQATGLFNDDSQFDSIYIERKEKSKGGHLVIQIGRMD
jgi:crossover junction endodeoxyribonuclease RusA